MRLHRLVVTAFGPFAGTETVDFDALGADGLFLVHGETGAGKTTVLDAVAFALFGRVPGARNDAKRLRSDHADPAAVPSVELELTVGGSRVVVTRSPAWDRPKKRGSGTTPQNATASVRWTDGSGRGPVAGNEETARVAERLVGMTAEQFTQVVLLPQGDFARFLRAETAEREQLLEQVFGTARFSRVEDWFRARRTETGRRVDAGESVLTTIAARLAQVAGTGQPAAVDAPWLEGTASALADTFAAATAADDGAGAEVARHGRALSAARERAGLVRRSRDLTARRDAAAAASVATGAERATLDAARRAVAVVPADVEAHRAAGVAERVELAATRAVHVLGLAEPGSAAPSAAEPSPAGLRETALQCRDEASRLAELEHRLVAGAAQRSQCAQLADELAAIDTATETARGQLEEQPALVAAARAAVGEAASAHAGLANLETTSTAAATALTAGRHRDEAAGRATELVAVASRARTAEQDAREHWLRLREQRLSGMAAELAARLADGQACPVCGSTGHPVPAEPGPTVVSEADESRAHTDHERTQARLTEADRAVTTVERELAAARAVSGDTPVVQLRAEAQLRGRTYDAAAGLAVRRGELDADLALCEQGVAALRELLTELDQRRAGLVADLTGREREAAELAEQERLARGSDPDVPARRRRLLAGATAATAAADALTAADAARADALDRLDRAGAAAVRAGFPDLPAARAAARADGALAALAARVEATAVEHAAVAAGLADPELAGVDPSEVVDLDGADASVRAADERRAGTRRATALAEQAATNFAALTTEWDTAEAAHAPLRAAHDELSALTETLDGRGQNAQGLSLRSYVLAARLDDVTATASDRLGTMTGGRYALTRGTGTGRRGTAGGLGIDVVDTWTGVSRPAKTLSGGESFLASLALALALADVVSAEAGGAVLDTLFVDEGFGTLDPETLDLVMGTLEGLRAGGRVVGLVSHVAELHERIPTRLHVRKTRSGSTLSTTAA